MPYSIEADQRALTSVDRDPSPPIPLTTAQRAHYRGVIKALPPTAPMTTAILGLAAALAVTLDEIEICNAELGRLKRLTTAKGKPHPLLQVRHTAAIRAATLSSRLRLLPPGDQREAARAARHNSRFAAAEVDTQAPELAKVRRLDGSVDWKATAERKAVA